MDSGKRYRFLQELRSTIRSISAVGVGACLVFASKPPMSLAQEGGSVPGPSLGAPCDTHGANCDASGRGSVGMGTGAQCDGLGNASNAASGSCDSLGGAGGALSGVGEDGVWFPAVAATRQRWAENGIAFQNNLTQFYFGNTSGGAEQLFRYAGHGDYLTNFDFGKLLGTPGAFLKVRAEHRFGRTINDAAGVVLPPTIAADLPVVDSTNLYLTNVLFTQALSESFVMYAGKLDTLDGDMNAFAHGRGIRQFSNGALVANPIALRTIPYSTLGTGMAWLLDGEPWLIFNVLNATDTTRTSGFNELFNEGVALASEMRVPTNFFGKPGHQLIAGTWNSRSYTSLDQDPRIVLPNVPIAKQNGSWSLYWNCDQYLVSDSSNPKRGWGYFARAGIADQGTNPIGYFLSSGIGGSSPLRNRERDSFGVGYYFLGASNQIAPFINTIFGNFGDGMGVEIYYNIATRKRLTITPDLQIIAPPRQKYDTALVAGLRANYNF